MAINRDRVAARDAQFRAEFAARTERLVAAGVIPREAAKLVYILQDGAFLAGQIEGIKDLMEGDRNHG